MTETKHQKFQRLMPPRLEKAVYHIGLLNNLASHNYEFTAVEVNLMLLDLNTAVQEVTTAFGQNLAGNPPPMAVELVELDLTPPPPIQEHLEGEPHTGPIRDEDITAAIQHLVYKRPDKALEILRQALLEEPR